MDSTIPTPTRAQTKRSSDSFLQEPAEKIPHVAKLDSKIEVSVSYAASGKRIGKLKISKQSSVADLKKSVRTHIRSGDVTALLIGETVLGEHDSLGAFGIENGTEVKVILAAPPTLFLANPEDFGQDFGSDDEDFESNNNAANPPRDISEAPEVALQVANAMMAAAPDLAECGDLVGGDESCSGGAQVIIIANPGNDAKMACLRALNTPKYNEHVREALMGRPKKKKDQGMPLVWRCATIEEAEFSKHLKEERGFNGSDSDQAQMLDVTKIMAESLEKHFVFGFSEDLVCAPHVWGGYASDGNIVGVKASRVWT